MSRKFSTFRAEIYFFGFGIFFAIRYCKINRMPPNIVNHEQAAVDRHNEAWRIRLHRQLDALCDDAEARKGFFGFIFLQINYRGKVDSVETNIKQTIR